MGDYFEHLGLLLSLYRKGLLSSGEYFVVGVDTEHYDPSQPQKHFRGKSADAVNVRMRLSSSVAGILKSGKAGVRGEASDVDPETAFQSYAGILSSPPSGFEDFSRKVNEHLLLPPFQFENPVDEFGGQRRVRGSVAG